MAKKVGTETPKGRFFANSTIAKVPPKRAKRILNREGLLGIRRTEGDSGSRGGARRLVPIEAARGDESVVKKMP